MRNNNREDAVEVQHGKEVMVGLYTVITLYSPVWYIRELTYIIIMASIANINSYNIIMKIAMSG